MLATAALFTGSFAPIEPPPTPVLLALFNGADAATEYAIGAATSDDDGVTWTLDPDNPVIDEGTGDPVRQPLPLSHG